MVHILVHIATAAIDWNVVPEFRRLGAFPNHQAEAFRLFWLAPAAVGALIFSGFVIAAPNRAIGCERRNWLLRAIGAALLLVIPLSFCIWCDRWEFARISPDMASAVISAHWTQLVGLAVVVWILTACGAHRRLRNREARLTVQPHSVDGTDNPTRIHSSTTRQ